MGVIANQGFTVAEIDIDQIMNLYERLMGSVKKDLLNEYKNTRISGPTYADMLASLQKAAMTGAMQSVVSYMSKETDADRCLKRAQCDKITEEITASTARTTRDDDKGDAEVELIEAKTKAEDIKNGDAPDKGSHSQSLYGYNKLVLGAQDKLYQRQKTGFDDNARQKYYDSSVSAFSIMFQDVQSDVVPSNMDVKGIETIGGWVKQNVGK